MKISFTIILILIFISLQSCCTKTVKTDSTTDKKNNSISEQTIQNRSKDISPSTADVQAEIISYNELSGELRANLKIEKVNNYGSATPPLAIGSVIICDVPESLLKEKNQTISELFKEGDSHLFLIQHQFGMKNKENISDWRIISFK